MPLCSRMTKKSMCLHNNPNIAIEVFCNDFDDDESHLYCIFKEHINYVYLESKVILFDTCELKMC